MFELAISIIISLCYVSGLLLRYVPFKSSTTSKQKMILFVSYAAALVANISVLTVVFRTNGISILSINLDLLVFSIVNILVNIIMIRGRTREHLFVYGITINCNYLIVSIPTYIVTELNSVDVATGYIIAALIHVLLLVIFYHPTRNLLRNTVEPFLILDSGNYWRIIWFIPIAMFFAMYFAFPWKTQVYTIMHIISRALTVTATILMCLSVAADHKRLAEKKAIEDQLTIQRLHYAQLQQKVEDARKLSHDFKHHIAAIRHFIDTDNKEGLRDYCNDLYAWNMVEMNIPYTGNAAADGVFYRYSQLAHENSIKFNYSGKIKSNGIADMDICVLLGNALDNALNGCLTVSENRSISVISQAEEQTLSIVVQNSFDGEIKRNEDDDILLSRKRGNKPGVGLKSMKAICSQYGGTLETKWDENTFTILLLLPIKH